MPRHIPPGKEDLWKRQAASDKELQRLADLTLTATHRREDLVKALGWDDPLVDEADEEMARRLDEYNREVTVNNRIYQERMAGLSSWIDHDPTAPVCPDCHGAGGPPGHDAHGACKTCRGWGRESRPPIPVWNEKCQEWVDPATGRTVDLLADSPSAAKEGTPDMPLHEPDDPDHVNDPDLTDIAVGQHRRIHRADGTEVDYERTTDGWRKVDNSDTRENPALAERRRAEDRAVEDRLARARAERKARTARAREESAKRRPPPTTSTGGTTMSKFLDGQQLLLSAAQQLETLAPAVHQDGDLEEIGQILRAEQLEGEAEQAKAQAEQMMAEASGAPTAAAMAEKMGEAGAVVGQAEQSATQAEQLRQQAKEGLEARVANAKVNADTADQTRIMLRKAVEGTARGGEMITDAGAIHNAIEESGTALAGAASAATERERTHECLGLIKQAQDHAAAAAGLCGKLSDDIQQYVGGL